MGSRLTGRYGLTRAVAAREIAECARALGKSLHHLTMEDWTRHCRRSNAAITRLGWRWADALKAAEEGCEDDIAAQDVDLPVVPLPEGQQLRGVSTLVGPDGETKLQWIKTKDARESAAEAWKRVLSEIEETVPVRQGSIEPPGGQRPDDLMAVYAMGDPHCGLLAWDRETGGGDFDLGVFTRLMCSAARELTRCTPHSREAMVVSVGDYFHADDKRRVTPQSGHILDVDGRWEKILVVGVDAMVAMVDAALETHDLVTVVAKPGNHDPHSSFYLAIALQRHYRLEPRVTVDASPSYFYYRRWHANLIGVTHGDTCKPADLAQLMATDRAMDWGHSRHRLWLTGHLHHEARREYRGCVVETLPTLAARDGWTSRSAYRSSRSMTRIALHREHGEVSRSTVSAAYLEALVEETAA